MIINWDFETRSECDLTATGAYIYAAHPTTRLLVVKYTFDGGKTFKTWSPWKGEKMPRDLDRAIDDPNCIFVGWNANFERLIMRHVVKRDIPVRRFRCTMAQARAMALPGKLELCARALAAPVQKMDNALMMRWAKPLSEGGWADDPDEFEQLCEYCEYDVLTEIGIGSMLRPMSDEEWEDYFVNEEINDRGLPIDIDLVKAAQFYAKDETAEINAQLVELTRGKVKTVKQYQKIKDWINPRLPPELQLKPTIVTDKKTGKEREKISFDRNVREKLLAADYEDLLVGDARAFIQLVHDGGRASTAKFAAMEIRSGADGRLRGAYVFNGAGQTGRISSTGAQTHNMVRNKLVRIEDVVEAILRRAPKQDIIKIASYDTNGALILDPGEGEPIKKPYDLLTILSRTLRPSIVAPIGRVLVWGDWSAIEARVLPWLSLEPSAQDTLDIFKDPKQDIYKYQALSTFGVARIADVTKDQRQACKVQILSLGYGGGVGAFQAMARNYRLRVTDEKANEFKISWRMSNPWAQKFWTKLETAAYNAMRNPETEFTAGRVSYMFAQGSLWCMLPSGRMLCYPFARLDPVEDRWGELTLRVTAIKASLHPAANSNDWPRMSLWGGIQAENVTQGEAASLLRYGRRELFANDWYQIGDTHDELLVECDEHEEAECKLALHDIMIHPPECFNGLPLAAEVESGFVYGK